MTTITIINANAAAIPLPDQSVHAVVTSPPYYGLRDYGNLPLVWPNGHTPCAVGDHVWGDQLVTHQRGTAGTKSTLDSNQSRGRQQTASQGNFCQRCGAWRGSLGLEPTPQLYVDHLVAIFREVWRVLRDDGVCFLNLGDSYAGYWGDSKAKEENRPSSADRNGFSMNSRPSFHDAFDGSGIKPKDLMLIPARVALALQQDGWYLRNEIIWAKAVSFNSLGYSGTTMPESVTDRFTRAHETIWLLSKQPRYYMDMDAIKETSNVAQVEHNVKYAKNYDNAVRIANAQPGNVNNAGIHERANVDGTRNPRDVITINPHPYKGAHFAAWPPTLVEVMVKPATSAKGACPACGASWVRVVEHTATVDTSAKGIRFDTGKTAVNGEGRVQSGERYTKQTTGWEPSCDCDAGEPIPCTVLDPFAGSGTTGQVCAKLGRNFIGLDLNHHYLSDLATVRTSNVQTSMQF